MPEFNDRRYEPTWVGHNQVPRNAQGQAPSRAYRYAHHQAVAGYESEGVPKGTYFSYSVPDDRYKTSDNLLVSVPYSDEYFRSSVNFSGEHYLSTTSNVPPEMVKRHHD